MKKLLLHTLALFAVVVHASGDKGRCELLSDYSRSAVFAVQSIHAPESVEDLRRLLRSTQKPVAVRGAGFSMGGQTAAHDGVVVEMKNLNQVLEYDVAAKTIRVQAGATWRQIQERIDGDNLAVMIMQSYNNFQVGGSISVNAHGRYVGYGPLVSSVLELTVMLADGSTVKASRSENSELFAGIVGGYAALGIVVDAKLQLVENSKLERKSVVFKNKDIGAAVSEFLVHFDANVATNPDAQMLNADIYPPDYDTVRSITFAQTDAPTTVPERLQPKATRGFFADLKRALVISAEQLFPAVKRWRANRYAPNEMSGERVVWRNWEASYDNAELMSLNDRFPALRNVLPLSDRKTLLQEYFIPKAKLPEFISKLVEIYKLRKVNISNISLRHVPANNESMLSWSKEESFAVVVYYTQPYEKSKKEKNLAQAQEWTREVIAEVERLGGSFYLPYQVYATRDQFNRAYPRHQEFFNLKRRYDPEGKFNNSLWEQYNLTADTYHYQKLLATAEGREELRLYFKNIFSINEPERFISAIDAAVAIATEKKRDLNDRNIYEELLRILPGFANGKVKAFVKTMQALRVQQREMAVETAEALKEVGVTSVRGYVEIGSPGRYVRPLSDYIKLQGPMTAVNDSFGAAGAVESSWGWRVPASITSKKIKLSNYDMIPQSEVANESVDLVSMFIGLHHCPPEKLEAFIASIARVIRTGGHFILRDHDANEHVLAMAFIAHSTYNAGLGIPFGGELGEIRNLHPLSFWKDILGRAGLEFVGKEITQEGDPTGNTLMVFKKVERTPAVEERILAYTAPLAAKGEGVNLLPGYHRERSNTYMTQAEWFLVDIFYELSDFMRNQPWNEFPYSDFINLYRDVYKKHRAFAQLEGLIDAKAFKEYDEMDAFLLTGITGLFKAMGFAAKISSFNFPSDAERLQMVQSQQFLADFFRDYADFMSWSTWYNFDYTKSLATFKQLFNEQGSFVKPGTEVSDPSTVARIDRSLMRQTKILFAAMQLAAYPIKRFLSEQVVDPKTRFLVKGDDEALAGLRADDKVQLIQLGDDLVLAQTERYVPFTAAMRSLAGKEAKVINVAGNKHISVIATSMSSTPPKLKTPIDGIMSYRYPTHPFGGSRQDYFHTVRILVSDLPAFLAEADQAGLKVLRVHDY